MIAVDPDDNVHVVWMMMLTNGMSRHIDYNIWNPDSLNFVYPGGDLLDQSQRAGYVTLAINLDGLPYAAFHVIDPSSPYPHPVVVPIGCSIQINIPEYGDGDILWPQIAISADRRLHVLSASNMWANSVMRIYYSQGIPIEDSLGHLCDIEWQQVGGANNYFALLDSSLVVGHTNAASRTSSRVALGWLRSSDSSQFNNDIILRLSEDFGESWQPSLYITSFVQPDTCWIDSTHWVMCDRDTLRAYTDLSLLFDHNAILHAAFTTIGYWVYRDTIPTATASASLIWHWNEATGQFSLLADGWVHVQSPGVWQTIVQRPSLAVDENTGYLYCAYVRYDTSAYSENGYPNADVWISVSTDNGSHWSVGTNVTHTTPAILPAPAGQGMNEREPTLAEVVTDGYLHLSYVLDRDAGSMPQGEGVVTLNPFIYQRIPVDSIPTTPLMPQYPLHWDSSGFLSASERSRVESPSEFQLHAAYPNPFNSSTRISFDLPQSTNIELRVFNVLGRTVEVLKSGPTAAGHHALSWDASNLASGVYFVSLKTASHTQTKKVLLLR
jgi:hypothetical protein